MSFSLDSEKLFSKHYPFMIREVNKQEIKGTFFNLMESLPQTHSSKVEYKKMECFCARNKRKMFVLITSIQKSLGDSTQWIKKKRHS